MGIKTTLCAIAVILSLGQSTVVLHAADDDFDHVTAIKKLTPADAVAGKELYALHCAACHGKEGNLALNPLARRFAKDELKFGNDPYALWKTISYGNGLMFRWDAVLTPEERYQIVHHLREDILKPNNPSQYFEPDDVYYDGLNERALADAEEQAAGAQRVEAAAGMIDGSGGTRMQYGPFLQYAVAYSPIKDANAPYLEDTTEKAIMIDLQDSFVICYDAARLSLSGLWSGDRLADTDETHHTSYKGRRPMMPGGELLYHHVDATGWLGGSLSFNGHYLHGRQVVLDYAVGGRRILETPQAMAASGVVVRHFQIEPGEKPLKCLVARRAPNGPKLDIVLAENSPAELSEENGAFWLGIPATAARMTVSVSLSVGGRVPRSHQPEAPDFDLLLDGGPRRWPQTVQTALARGENVEGYAADELTVPLANPYGSWMRLTALGFFSDGRLAVSTLSGDVWIVSWEEGNPNALTWSRFASGLYEPMGLEIVDDEIYVRGRDRITLLHDLNQDGEADFYESFYEDPGEIGAGYHAFSYDLVADDAGYFYFAQGAWKSPLTGAVVRVSPEGEHAEMVATDLRNPNGLGAGGSRQWVTVADNPSGVALYNGFTLVRDGGTHGFARERNTPMLVVLPARVDSSSAGQCWSDPERWGPLSGSVIHTSYSRSSAFYCFIQDIDPFPNGFAMRLPFDLKAGAMRARVNPVDGQVYIACKRGWDSVARLDGVVYRIRHTGQPSHLIQDAAATEAGIRLTFASELDPSSVKPSGFTILREPDKPEKGVEIKPKPVAGAVLVDSRTVEVAIPGIEHETLEHRTNPDGTVRIDPAISLTVNLAAADGTPISQTVHATINSLP